ncbi:hypothetical protein EDD16DRAFT_419472 [Pisolithus croceorrhizus]|nr:hypothetical protein F5141DRAFT_178242 [Pisolithus sp. B1]KAI6132593.1 hypothetical protein EDD16DRAFT_419472 [Pisolithus croceorrhizus]
MSQLAIVTLSGCHCLRSLSLDPTVAMDTDAAFIAQAPLAWSNIEDLSLRGWQRCESHRAKLEGKSELLRGCPGLCLDKARKCIHRLLRSSMFLLLT